jgi:DNA polymerase III subunit gamma/tau
MAQALYRKYRSKSFDDVVGQDHITRTLKNAIRTGRISHAYLFTGPRGVGKTSVARILAHEANSLDYSDESIHLDIIEIDAASNRRIDEIRDLRERVRVAPASAKYKVYIIDEVHMLTREAFNALLKTLEEPPAHCIFILATTEAHKLPETIISRTQRFEFKPVGKFQAAQHLENIAHREKIKIDKPALELLAEFGNGSFRDSISYLDQLSSLDKKISEDDVRDLLGLPAAQAIKSLLGVMDSGDTAALLSLLRDIEGKGINPQAVAAALSAELRELAMDNKIKARQTRLLRSLLLVSASPRPQEMLEITLLDLAAAAKSESKPAAQEAPAATKTADKQLIAKAEIETDAVVLSTAGFDLGMWDEIVERSKSEAASIYTALRLAVPEYHNGKLTLNFQFPLHQKKLEQAKNKHMVAKLIESICGSKIDIDCVVNKKMLRKNTDKKPAEKLPIGAISNIFGSAEVIEA